MKILIVEDEILIAETVKMYLAEKDYQITDICISYDEAITSYNMDRPDLVLLDIRLYGNKSGIDVANYIRNTSNPAPFIYLTSQYDDHVMALAIEAMPAGYLTKPIQKSTLYTTLKTIESLHVIKSGGITSLTITDGGVDHVVMLADVTYLKADHVYVEIHRAAAETMIIRETLSVMEDILPASFLRIHRTYIVNRASIRSATRSTVVLHSGTTLPISRSRQADVAAKLAEN